VKCFQRTKVRNKQTKASNEGSWIWCSHSGDYEEYYLLGCDIMAILVGDFRGFPQSRHHNAGIVLEITHDRLSPNPYLLTIYSSLPMPCDTTPFLKAKYR
jgi:hypothetical protein